MTFEKIKYNFEQGFWTSSMVRMAVKKGAITQGECDSILDGNEPEQVNEQAFIASIMQEVSEYGY